MAKHKSKAKRHSRKGVSPAKRIIVATEGRETEPLYFGKLKELRELRNLSIVGRKATRSTPVDVVKSLINFQNNKINQVRKGDELWAVIDHDQHDIDAAIKRARKSKIPIQFADSNPCFEMWLIMHHGALSQHRGLEGAAGTGGCAKVVDYLKRHIDNNYNKCNYDAAKYVDLIATAIQNAESADTEPHDPLINNIGSRVYRLAQAIIDSSTQGLLH